MTVLKKAFTTSQAPQPIGPYSQAIRVNDTVYISGQVPINPETNQVHEGTFKQQLYMMFDNLKAITEAAGGSMNQIVRISLYLIDLSQFALVNEVMAEYFSEPYPARSTIGVASLPKNVPFEVDAIMVLHQTTGR
ncbi:MAG: RidA family protein [Legionellales bacterium]|nr:RidA family protein [Legionellales bacterium]